MTPATALPDGLYAIADTATIQGDLIAAVNAAIQGGVKIIQYRDKSADHARRAQQAQALQALCQRHSVALIINDDVDLAADCGAAGVHIGADDGTISAARRRLHPGQIIGVSCYNSLDTARQAVDAGADTIAFGSFFPSPTKPNAVRATPDLLTTARDFNIPVTAIGGITVDNGKALVTAGANQLAVISGVFGAANIEQAARDYAGLFSLA